MDVDMKYNCDLITPTNIWCADAKFEHIKYKEYEIMA